MQITADIIRSWLHPRKVMARRLSEGAREDRALAYLMIACVLIFVAQWPRLARDAQFDPSTPLDVRLGGTLFGWLFIAPLALYTVALLSHFLALLLGGKGNSFAAPHCAFLVAARGYPAVAFEWAGRRYHWTRSRINFAGGISLAVFFVVWISSLIEN